MKKDERENIARESCRRASCDSDHIFTDSGQDNREGEAEKATGTKTLHSQKGEAATTTMDKHSHCQQPAAASYIKRAWQPWDKARGQPCSILQSCTLILLQGWLQGCCIVLLKGSGAAQESDKPTAVWTFHHKEGPKPTSILPVQNIISRLEVSIHAFQDERGCSRRVKECHCVISDHVKQTGIF